MAWYHLVLYQLGRRKQSMNALYACGQAPQTEICNIGNNNNINNKINEQQKEKGDCLHRKMRTSATHTVKGLSCTNHNMEDIALL